MDLGDEERYAAAALYTLALHATQVESGLDCLESEEERRGLWGCPCHLDIDAILSGETSRLSQQDVGSFWGWDSCGPSGLCEQVYQQLNIPKLAWMGLLKTPQLTIPTTNPRLSTGNDLQGLVMLVGTYSRLLDPALNFCAGWATLPKHSQVCSQNEYPAARAADSQDPSIVGADHGGDLCESSGSKSIGLSHDLHICTSQGDENGIANKPCPPSTPRVEGSESVATDTNQPQTTQEEADHVRAEDCVSPREYFGPREQYSHEATAKAVMALWDLTLASISMHEPNKGIISLLDTSNDKSGGLTEPRGVTVQR
eukprot:evm.model.scf_238EXC.11 EVM.evm.TU.scf_238EXC.11   scf_238EXC:98438-100403(-)